MLKHLIYLIYHVMCPVTASGVTEQLAVQHSATNIAGILQNPKRPWMQTSIWSTYREERKEYKEGNKEANLP